jgi:hypothetical protein
LATPSAGGAEEAGGAPCGGAENPEGTATCTLAISNASASVDDSATASLVSNVGAGIDGAADAPAGTVLDIADTPGGGCAAPAAGMPAASATGSSPMETSETAMMEGMERGTTKQLGEKDLTPDTTTLAAAVVPSTSLRRSKRVVAVADVHTLHKAELMAAKRNLESKGISFTSYSDCQILSNLGRIGINLGTSDVVVIKNLEVDRLVLCAKQKKNLANSSTVDSNDEQDERLDAVLSHACGDLNENVLDTERDHILDLAPVQCKKKYNNAKNPKNGKLPRKPKTPSKIILK